ncbi:MAG: hypothetical protein J2P24_08630, partial [Streptosporangiales bacterium]|nr:hypothetical protein [Streptosporangiales bacterium]
HETRKRAKDMAKVLGVHQDAVIARELLRDVGMRAHMAGENGFTFGLLYGEQTTRARDAERAFADVWDRLAAKKHRRWLG